MNKLLYSIQEVYQSYLREKHTAYSIPDYQRGYKWSPQQVKQLLDDIHQFEAEEQSDQFYCLQNITLIDHNNKLNVVDGQQRLTTTFLLLRYLEQIDLIKGKLSYDIRAVSNVFLQQLVSDHALAQKIIDSTDFHDFLNHSKEEEDYDYQDIYFMYTAYRSIHQWFAGKENLKEAFKRKLLHDVKLIVNHVQGVEEKALFMNLNTGRVHLDGADLVRAIIITRVAKQEIAYFDPTDTQHIVKLNEKRLRIGLQLDELNAWWSLPKVQQYFAVFSTLKPLPTENITFDVQTYPINQLYTLWSETKGNKNISLSNFESKEESILQLFHGVIAVHRTLKHWYEDREIYHYLGFLRHHTDVGFATVWKWWNEQSSTQKVKQKLKDTIKEKVFGNATDEEKTGMDYWLGQMSYSSTDLSKNTNWYTHDKLLVQILLLLDIIAHTKNETEGNSLPFLAPYLFKRHQEDIEHIYPSTPKELKALEAEEKPITQINGYIEGLNEHLEGEKNHIGKLDFEEEEWSHKDDAERQRVYEKLKADIHAKTPINSIGNLVLLHLSINRGIGNNSYDQKRLSVLENTRSGHYVRKHTQDVFVKYTMTTDLNQWGMDDIITNAENIKETISTFFGNDPVIRD